MTQKDKLFNIATIICGYYCINLDDFYSHSRKSNLVKARQVFIYLSKEKLGISWEELAVFLGKDSSTISKCYNKLLENIKYDKFIKSEIQELKEDM